jgi:hypothetical protein
MVSALVVQVHPVITRWQMEALYELGLWIESHGDLEFYSTTLISGTIAAVLGTKIYCLQTPALPSTVRFNFSLISIRDMIASYIMKCHTTSTM